MVLSAKRVQEIIKAYWELKEQYPGATDTEIAKLIPRKDGRRGISQGTLRNAKYRAGRLGLDVPPGTRGKKDSVMLDPSRVQTKVFRGFSYAFATSDWHIGDFGFMLNSLWDMFEQVPVVDDLDVVIVGDVVAGVGIYRGQEYESLGPEIQVRAAAVLIHRLDEYLAEKGIKRRRWIILRGNHDRTPSGIDLSMMVASYARNIGVDAHGAGWEALLSYDEKGILFVHGFGSSQYRPQSPKFLNALTKRVLALLKAGLPVTRVCHGHLHWFDIGFEFVQGVWVDSLGGLQACRRGGLGLVQRPPGGILYHHSGDEIIPRPIRPTQNWIREAEDPSILSRNLKWLGDALDEWERITEDVGKTTD